MNDTAARNVIVAAFRAGDLQRAEQASRNLLAASPHDRTALQVLGAIAYQRAQWPQAVEWLGKTVKIAPKDASARFNFAEALRETGDKNAATRELRATLALSANHVPALVTLARMLGESSKSGDIGEALILLDRAAKHAPDDPKVFLVRGSLRFRTDQPGAADDLARAVRLDSNLVLAHFYLGLAAAKSGDFDQADASLARVNEIEPDSAPAYVERGKIASLRNDPAAAEALYRLALERVDNVGETHALLAETLLDLRRHNEAAEAIGSARALDPQNQFARLIEAKLARSSGEPEAARALLEPLLAERPESNIATDGAYELGLAFDALAKPDDAITWSTRANKAVARSPQTRAIDRAAMPNRIAAMAALAPAKPTAPAEADKSNADDRPPPHFIVGFPRSGTTLIEAILASHPAFVTSGEAPMISRLIRGFDRSYPRLLEDLSESELSELRGAYWREAEAALPGLAPNQQLIDKQPWNLIELPFIVRLFPGARIVTVLRDPRDVCLSCFQQYFALNAGNVHFLALDRTAAIYAQTMGLWQALRSDPAITSLEVRYEDVVDDFEAAVTGLLEFLDAPWDDAVRDFPATAAGRVIRTPSRDAVTHEIYASSVGRWKRYADHLSDILPTLEPLVAAFGYGEK